MTQLRTGHLGERFELFRFLRRTLLVGVDVDADFLSSIRDKRSRFFAATVYRIPLKKPPLPHHQVRPPALWFALGE